jgi:flagellin-specific chaperone FliS
MKLFEFIRKKSVVYFLIVWGISLFLFGIIYWLLTLTGNTNNLLLGSKTIEFGFFSLLETLYISLLISTLLGLGSIGYSGIYTPLIYIQAIFSAVFLLILAEKIAKTYIDIHGHQQDKKVNTMMLMMSVIRNDMDRITHDNKINKKHIRIKDVESIIDGLYVVFLDMEKIFSQKNIHRHKLRNTQFIMLTENVDDSLFKINIFITYMEHHHITWKDKSVEFWMHYILDTAEKIVLNLEDSNIKTPRLLIAIANIRDNSEKIRTLVG